MPVTGSTNTPVNFSSTLKVSFEMTSVYPVVYWLQLIFIIRYLYDEEDFHFIFLHKKIRHTELHRRICYVFHLRLEACCRHSNNSPGTVESRCAKTLAFFSQLLQSKMEKHMYHIKMF